MIMANNTDCYKVAVNYQFTNSNSNYELTDKEFHQFILDFCFILFILYGNKILFRDAILKLIWRQTVHNTTTFGIATVHNLRV